MPSCSTELHHCRQQSKDAARLRCVRQALMSFSKVICSKTSNADVEERKKARAGVMVVQEKVPLRIRSCLTRRLFRLRPGATTDCAVESSGDRPCPEPLNSMQVVYAGLQGSCTFQWFLAVHSGPRWLRIGGPCPSELRLHVFTNELHVHSNYSESKGLHWIIAQHTEKRI